MDQDTKDDDKFWLYHLRRNPGDILLVDSMIRQLRLHVAQYSMTLKSVGISEQELAEIRHNALIASAKKWLKCARNPGRTAPLTGIDQVREYTKEAGVTLESIGTSEDELKNLLRAIFIRSALRWLEYARGPRADRFCNGIMFIRQYMEQAGEPLESIGTSDPELNQLEASYTAAA